jgi:CRP-like cAMP-binding protein
LFSTLPDEALHRLERATRVVSLPAGVVLIRQGDPAGSAFASSGMYVATLPSCTPAYSPCSS